MVEHKLCRFLFFCLIFGICRLTASAETNPSDYLLKDMPETWHAEQTNFQTLPTEDAWWITFNDTVLTRLISLAVENNYNVGAAVKRIEMAKKMVRSTESSYYPTISANFGWTKMQESGAVDRMGTVIRSDYFSLGATMNWEIDVFGRVYANVKEKKAALNVSRADYDAVMVSLCANVATAYMELRMYQEELRVAKEHIASQEYVVKITEARYNADLGNLLDVTQAKVVLFQTESSLPTIEANIETMKNSIAVLCGSYPGELNSLLTEETYMPQYSMDVAAGLPSDLLRRRPDIVESEMELAEYAAQIGIAKKDFLPTLSLTGTVATTSKGINGLFGKNSLEYNIAPQLSWTIFEGLARNYNLAEAKLQFEAALDQYNLTVMNAVEEVDNAMTNYTSTLRAIELQKKVVEESRKSMELSFDLYRSGLTMFSNVVDGQISWLTNQNTLVTLEGKALMDLVTLYQALGGGWELFPADSKR